MAESKSAVRRVEATMSPPTASVRPCVWVTLSICVVYFITRLDSFTDSSAVRQVIISLLDWGTLYNPFFPGRIWAPFTAHWFHTSVWHIVGNLAMLVMLVVWMRKSSPGQWWLAVMLIGGAIGNTWHVQTHDVPPGDWANWHGSLVLLMEAPHTPLAGASGGIFAVYGAATAIAFRYWLLRKQGITNRIGQHFAVLIGMALVQFVGFDLFVAGVAGSAHLVGFLAGAAMGVFLPIFGRTELVATEDAPAKLVTGYMVDNRLMRAIVELDPSFDDTKHGVALITEKLDWRLRATTHHAVALAGKIAVGAQSINVLAGETGPLFAPLKETDKVPPVNAPPQSTVRPAHGGYPLPLPPAPAEPAAPPTVEQLPRAPALAAVEDETATAEIEPGNEVSALAAEAEKSPKDAIVFGKMLGAFPVDHKVRRHAVGRPQIARYMKQATPKGNERDALRALGAMSVTAEPSVMRMIDAIRAEVDPPKGESAVMSRMAERRLREHNRPRRGPVRGPRRGPGEY